MGEATAHSLHTLASRRELASLSVPPVSVIAATCRAAAGSFAEHDAACDCKCRYIFSALLCRSAPIRTHFSATAPRHHCDLNGDTPRPRPTVRTVVLSVLAIVLPSSSSVPAVMEVTAPRPCACATYPGQMTARTRKPTVGMLS